MRYTAENTFDLGKPVKRVVDASGSEYPLYLEVDTDTGYIKYMDTYQDNQPIYDDHGNAIVIEVFAPKTITVEFYDEEF